MSLTTTSKNTLKDLELFFQAHGITTEKNPNLLSDMRSKIYATLKNLTAPIALRIVSLRH